MIGKTVDDYLNLITSEHRDKPKFIATVSISAGIYVQIQSLLSSMMSEGGCFDIDTPCVGNQEDIIGELVGVSRDVKVPIPGAFFTWDGSDPTLGWDSGSWAPANATDLTVLPDDAYLILIRAKIAANHWDGTTEGAYTIWAILLPQFTLLIGDLQNMSFIIAIAGAPLDPLTLALLTGGYLPLKPAGVRIAEYIVPVDTNPLFAWDVANSAMNGWDVGSWGKEIIP